MSTASILGNVQEMDPDEQRRALLGYLRPAQGIAPPVAAGAAAGLNLPAVASKPLGQGKAAPAEAEPTQRIQMPEDMPQLPASKEPLVSGPNGKKTGPWAPQGTVEGDTQERQRLLNAAPATNSIGNPFLRGLAKVGDAINPFVAIPGSTAQRRFQVAQNEKQLGQDVGNEGKEAATEHTKAETEQIKNPPDKFAPLPTEQGLQAFNPREGTATPLKDAAGNQLQPFSPEKVKTIDEQAYGTLISQGKTPVEALDTIYGSKNTKTEDLPHLYLDALQSGDQAKAALIKKAHEDTQVKPVQPPGVTMIVPDGQGGGTVQRLTPGMTVAPGAQTAAGVNTMNTATTQMRNVGAQASLVHEQTPQLLQQIDQMKDALGPVSGRWNEYMQGKIGMDKPRFADLRANLLMYSSAVALMHARGRLPENLREEFDRAINAPKQTPANLEAVIKRIDQWTSANMNAMQRGGKPGTETQSGSGLGVNLKDAMALPQNKGKSEADVRKDIEAHGHKVVE